MPLPLIFPAQRAATPATWGMAILVPLSVLHPPPTLAEMIPTPGPDTLAPVFENGATVKPRIRPLFSAERFD
jgi:hypothetical protein